MRIFLSTYLQFCLRTLLLSFAAVLPFNGAAYDFYYVSGSGNHIFFNILPGSKAEITYENRLSPTLSYSGAIYFPEKVRYEGSDLTVTSVSDYAFFGCRDLSEVHLPSTVTSIGRWAFGWCDAITELELPVALTDLEPDAFDGCFSLASISVAAGNANFKVTDNAVMSADGSTLLCVNPTAEGSFSVPSGTLTLGRRSLGGCTFVDEISLPSSLTSIETNALGFCNSITSVTVPSSVEEIGTGAFADCYSLAHIEVEPGNNNFSSHRGILYNADASVLLQCPGACLDPEINPATSQIAPMAFIRNYGVTSIVLPQAVTKIGEASFAGCENMVSALLPENVTEIEAMAFGLCSSLHSLYVMNPHPENISLGEGVFTGVDTETCTLYVPRGKRASFMRQEQWRDFQCIVETDPLLEQAISWPSSADEYVDDSHVTLHASSSAMLAVEYSLSPYSTGIASLQGNVLECIVPGAVDVIAYQRGNNTYMPAIPVVRTFFDPNAGIEVSTDDLNIRVYGIYGTIVIKGAPEDAVAQVFDVNGRSLYSGIARQIPASPGAIYAVRVAGRTFKVLVR